ncbi:exported hypothetical protein [Verrucomicrobia bacterium]|nr:exported hypothetical protein [Verrucomicrobiota bacterium]
MKRIGYFLSILMAALGAAYGDQFQFKAEFAGGLTVIPYATVSVTGNGKTFRGRTDKLGRATINLPAGVYDATLTENKNEHKATLTIDGSKTLKTVVAKP